MSITRILWQRYPQHVHPFLKSFKTTTLSAVSASLITATAITMIVPFNNSAISVTHCEGGNNDDNPDNILSKVKSVASGNFDWNGELDLIGKEIGAKIQQAVDTGLPTQISYGFVCGYSSGYALKKVGKSMSVVFGLGFITLQTLSYSGYIQVDHEKLKEKIENILDLNEDGKVDGDDVELAQKKIMKVLGYNMPAGGGFGAGFLGGIRSG